MQGVPTSAPTHSPTPATTPSSTSGEGECCCDAKINEVLANQATMLTALSGSATNSDSSTNSEETTSSSSSNGQITLDSSSVIIGTVLCATLFAGAVVAAVFYRKKVQELEEVLGRHAPLGSLELGGLGLSGNAY